MHHISKIKILIPSAFKKLIYGTVTLQLENQYYKFRIKMCSIEKEITVICKKYYSYC